MITGKSTFAAGPGGFTLGGKPFQVLAGGMHYFRVMPEQWPARLRLLRAMGLNTVDTYVPWNFHEPRPGEYTFDGLRDVERFLRDAAEAGLYAIVRPGPYICSEWDNGGLPAWLLADPQMRLRSSDPRFAGPLDRWFDELMPRLVPHQVSAGGNVICMQIENDYARFGSDTAYVEGLRDGFRTRGIDVPLYVCEAPLEVGPALDGIDGVIGSVWTEYDAESALAALRRQRPQDPAFLSELVCGPIQHWGEPMQRRDVGLGAGMLEHAVDTGASMSLYMAHGGTNFGLWSGANVVDDVYLPAVSSYDYDSPIDERGLPTEKFWRFREILSRVSDTPAPDDAQSPTLPPSTITMTPDFALLDPNADLPGNDIADPHPATFEQLGQQGGFVLYRSVVAATPGRHLLRLQGLGDRAQVFVDGNECALLERNGSLAAQLEFTNPETRLEILVESMGRVNFSPELGERKGITGARLDLRWLQGWTSIAIDIDQLAGRAPLPQARPDAAGPVLFRGELAVDDPADAFLGLRGWNKGIVWVNGFCLGRYWNRGPHRSLYLPAPLLRRGANAIAVLEQHPPVFRSAISIPILSRHDCD